MVLAGPGRGPLRRLARCGSATLGAALLVGLSAAPAAADVTVVGEGATHGGYARITFQVPAESRTADLIGVQVAFPPSLAVFSVVVEPKAGWTPSIRMRVLAKPLRNPAGRLTSEVAGDVSWTVNLVGVGLKPGEFDEFAILAGPLPAVDSIAFSATQSYSDGTKVAWSDPPATGTDPPDHPAPVLRVAPAPPPAGRAATAAPGAGRAPTAAVAGAYALAGLALVLGGAAVAVTRRRGSAGAGTP